MPIYLPPISRRKFLAGALAAGASLPGWAFGKEVEEHEEAESSRYLLFSDVHLGPHHQDEKHGVKPAVEFTRAVDHMLDLKNLPRRAVVTGDYAISWGNLGDYKMLRELTSRLSRAGVSCRFALGNHDTRKAFLEEFTDAREMIDSHAKELGKLVYVWETPHVNWFFLDMLHENDREMGIVGESQLGWLARSLDARRNKPALVVGHHNPVLDSKIRDTAAFYDVIVPRRQVKAYVYGHTHRWHLGEHEGIHLVNVPTVSAWKEADQPRGFLTADLHNHGMKVALHAVGSRDVKEHELAWREA